MAAGEGFYLGGIVDPANGERTGAPAHYDPALIERIKLAFRAAVDDPALTRDRRTQWARQLVKPASAVPESIQLFDARMRGIVERYYGGPFNAEIEAARARDKKAREVFGEYAWLNFPDEE